MKSKPPETAAVASSPAPTARGGADLHVHTTHSDGVCSPCEVVVAAARVGLAALAITDHDTVSALARGPARGRTVGRRADRRASS